MNKINNNSKKILKENKLGKENKSANKTSALGRKWQTIKSTLGGFVDRYLNNMGLQALIIAVLLELFIESMGHKAVLGGITFLFANPIIFLINVLIIFVTLTPAWLFRRRTFVYSIVSLLWLTIGIANGVVLQLRMTPFTTTDLSFLELGLSILPNYFSTTQTVLLCVALGLVVLFFVLLFIFGPKRKKKVNFKRSLAGILASALILITSIFAGIQTNVMATYFGNLWDAYYQYGVPYCFLNTWLNRGISKPADYSESMVHDALPQKELDTQTSLTQDKKKIDSIPNIVFLQLESFVDPDEIKSLDYEGQVVPFFKELKKNYSSGHLTVPAVGGGTANTEFEVMSGMSVRFFGPGEYPYNSILGDETCETMAYDMKKLGMGTHAIHNHRGAFYNRNTVFPHLGYDTFTSLEYISDIPKTPRNWSRDDVLLDAITGALDSTKTKDYIYTISVQGHGEYPRSRAIEDPAVKVLPNERIGQSLAYAYEYYIQQINEMDQVVKTLTEELESYDEDVVLVLYGDHLPALEMEDEDMATGSSFKTEYVMWSNFEMDKKDQDLATYQLSAYVQEQLGIREGTLTVYHQDNWRKSSTAYYENLELLQYDMLYGDRYIYNGKNPYKPTDMRMGHNAIKINEIVEVGGQYYISGENFTSFSKVSLGDEVLDTIYLSPTVLKLLEDVDPADVVKLKVSQVEKNKEILSTTE
jgi:phosphoglycerol transferase MdoB-like AlkP superfamily enzyme